MATPFSYTIKYTLDKDHFRECYAQSVITDNSGSAYLKSILLSVTGVVLAVFTDANPYAAWFLLLLGALEALSVYYKQAWWVMRQMLSKAANSEVTLTIDELGMTSQSPFAELIIEWESVKALTRTESGWLVEHDQGKNYLSNSCLTAQAIEFMVGKTGA